MRYLIAIVGTVILAACGNMAVKEQGYDITGKIENNEGRMLLLDRIEGNAFETIDTAIIASDGSFQFKGTVEQAGVYRFKIDKKHMWLFVLDNKSFDVALDYSNVEQYSVTGDGRFTQLMNLIDVYKNNYKSMSELKQNMMMKSQGGRPSDEEIAKYRMQNSILQKKLQDNLKAFIDTNMSEVSLFAIYSMDLEKELSYLSEQVPVLKERFPNNSLVKQLEDEIASYTRIQIGSQAQDLNFNDPNGNPIALSSLKGQVVLLDFWASWCKPCRVTNPELVKIYDEFKNVGFTVYSVSLDKNKDAWHHAIAQDKLAWPNHVSDLQGWKADGAQKYKVRSIPSTFLLNREGVIVARNLHGEQLRQAIKEIL